ncbi:branched-chain amino acid ABC transporter permease, partial [Acinetobacter baumannii]
MAVLVLLLLAVPAFASPFVLDLFAQVFIASIAALALMLLTGIAGQISLGHAGLLAAGAFTASILY